MHEAHEASIKIESDLPEATIRQILAALINSAKMFGVKATATPLVLNEALALRQKRDADRHSPPTQ